MEEKETWFAIEISRAGEGDWFANGNTTHDSAQVAWREVRKMRRTQPFKGWDFRVVRKDLVTTVEKEG